MTTNRKLLTFGLTILTAIACLLLLVVFNLTMRNAIINKGEDSIVFAIDDSTTDEDYYYSNEDYFDVFYIDMQEEDLSLLSFNQLALYDYYQEYSNELSTDYLYTYKDNFSYMIYIPYSIEEDTYIYYVNIYPMLEVLRLSTYLLLVVITLVILIISYLGYRSAKLLDESDQRTKNFFANASHELKTPLMSIGGFAEGLENGIVSPAHASKVITTETDRMTALVEYILNLSKVDSGMLELKLEKDDLREVLYEIIDTQIPNAELKSIKFEFDLPKPLILKYDESLMYSVLSNIIINNLRYASSIINISSEQVKNEILIHISNDGTIINPQVLPNLFNRFYKGEEGQTGIGLSLSMEYMKLHDGNIKVVSSEEKTTFTVSLPNR